MEMKGIDIRRAIQDDVTALCDVYFSAFHLDIFSGQAFPRSSGTGHSYWKQAFSEELTEPGTTFLVATISTSATSKEVVGFAKWICPGTPVHDYSRDIYPADGIPGIASEFYKKLAEGHQRCVGNVDHWYLDMMAVRNDHQNEGIGCQLLEWGLECSKRDDVVCFVESTAGAQSFYERFGFVEVDQMAVETPQGEVLVKFNVRKK